MTIAQYQADRDSRKDTGFRSAATRVSSAWLIAVIAFASLTVATTAWSAESDAPQVKQACSRQDAQDVIRDARKIVTEHGVEELEAVQIGGIRQWISVRGKDRRNPILLFIHGGPGSPMMPASWWFQSPWEEYFTVVQWDQRGAGKTRASNDAAAVTPTISVARMIADGEEVVAWLRERYAKQKIFVLGHSWGSVIGVGIAQRRPEWLHAYIGMGQVVNGQENERVGYAFALSEARAHRNEPAIQELLAIAPYPRPDGSVSVEQILTQRKWVINYGGMTWGRNDFNYEQNLSKLAPEYTREDWNDVAQENGASLIRLLGELAQLDYFRTKTFECPIFVFAGRHDYATPSQIASEWYAGLQAPQKAFVWFEQSSHMIPFEEPGKLLLHLVQDVRPLAVTAADAPPGANKQANPKAY